LNSLPDYFPFLSLPCIYNCLGGRSCQGVVKSLFMICGVLTARAKKERRRAPLIVMKKDETSLQG